jgi:hypothetical protein
MVKATMTRIAGDEARHAELSWRAAAWLDQRLDVRTRAGVNDARRGAVDALRRELRCEPHADLVRALGMPRAGEAAGLLAALNQALWR